MQKFENVDILACLDAVMKQNTGFYQSDFEIDKKIIHEAAASPDHEDGTLLWLSRPSGTHCFRERDVFLKDTRPYNTWKFHGEQTRDRILAYAVELTGSAAKSGETSMSWTMPPISGTFGSRRFPQTQTPLSMNTGASSSP